MNPKLRPERSLREISTRAVRLYTLLLDRAWHATQELVGAVGHTFAEAKLRLVRMGYSIEKRRSGDRNVFEYRMLPAGRKYGNLPRSQDKR